jgi:hypothetical protein
MLFGDIGNQCAISPINDGGRRKIVFTNLSPKLVSPFSSQSEGKEELLCMFTKKVLEERPD